MLDLRSDNQEIVAGLDLFFSPYGTGQNASVSGSDNEQNHYQLEYQLIPALRESRSLLYEEVPSDTTVDVGDLVFLNTGSVGGEFEPIDSNLHGGTFSYIEERRTTEQTRVAVSYTHLTLPTKA